MFTVDVLVHSVLSWEKVPTYLTLEYDFLMDSFHVSFQIMQITKCLIASGTLENLLIADSLPLMI